MAEWQTLRIQNSLLPEGACGFESHHPYQIKVTTMISPLDQETLAVAISYHGFWIYKDHGKYGVGRDTKVLTEATMSKTEAECKLIQLYMSI